MAVMFSANLIRVFAQANVALTHWVSRGSIFVLIWVTHLFAK